MTASNWIQFYHTSELFNDGTIDLDTNTFRVVLVTSDYTPNLAHTAWSDISANEVANGNGYTTHGNALALVTMTQAAGVGKWDAADPTWTATDSGITARYGMIVRDANGDGSLAAGDLPICYTLLDTTPADVTATAGNPLTITFDADGILKMTQS